MQFSLQGGFSHLIHLLMGFDIEGMKKTSLSRKTISLLLKLIMYFLEGKDRFNVEISCIDPKVVVKQLFDIIAAVSHVFDNVDNGDDNKVVVSCLETSNKLPNDENEVEKDSKASQEAECVDFAFKLMFLTSQIDASSVEVKDFFFFLPKY